MTKEELIALSDLNREDNIKYISSEAQGIAIALDSDRYAPTLCKLERAYICGRRKSKEQIEQLEKENAELKEQQFSLRNERNTFLAQNEQYEKDLIDFNENLTKAKEIIRELIHEISVFYIATDRIVISSTVKEAEQFLKDSEVEKC